jgi:hypothetical protein
MTTQWHSIFANLLRPLVEGHYDVQTDVPVGDVPRAADIVLLRRTSAAPPLVPLLQRCLILVSGREVAVERESLPVHLLAVESEEQLHTVARVLGQNADLLPAYGFWLAGAHPALAREVAQMGRTKSKKFALNFAPIIKEVGWREIIDQVGVKSLIDEVGLKPIIKEAGLDQLVAQLTPQQRQELQRLLQRTSPPGS